MSKIVLGDKVVLYGFHDGFSYDTDGTTNVVFALETGEKVELPIGYFEKADEIVRKDKIKIKDVIKRIKGFDVDTQKVWLNEILNELGSYYGSMKYKEGYEQGKLEGALECKKEKRYTVKVKAFLGQYLGRYYINNEILTPQFTRTQYTGKEGYPSFTRSELEQADFGWVFDCPGIELDEVEE